jgi:hypothetical protein
VTVLLEGVHPEEYHRALEQLDAARAKVDQLERDVDSWMGLANEAMEKLQEALTLAKRFKAERDEMPRCVGCGRSTSLICAEDGKPRCLRADCDAMPTANAAAAPSDATDAVLRAAYTRAPSDAEPSGACECPPNGHGHAAWCPKVAPAPSKPSDPAPEAAEDGDTLPLPTGPRPPPDHLAWILSGMPKVGRTSIDIHVFDSLRAELNAAMAELAKVRALEKDYADLAAVVKEHADEILALRAKLAEAERKSDRIFDALTAKEKVIGDVKRLCIAWKASPHAKGFCEQLEQALIRRDGENTEGT